MCGCMRRLAASLREWEEKGRALVLVECGTRRRRGVWFQVGECEAGRAMASGKDGRDERCESGAHTTGGHKGR